MSFFDANYRVVLGNDDDDDIGFDDEEVDVEEQEPKKTAKKARVGDEEEEDGDNEDIITCPMCGEELTVAKDELFEGARIICDSDAGCMVELEISGFDKENHPKFKVVEDEK
ncbi:MAG: hypothetical protein HY817_03435 [Candidatus Abawacabacteria bacterium]|nr:hypothetical protein [Candidatus Abawacabacteria bacterium]